MIPLLPTSEHRFHELPGYPFPTNYIEDLKCYEGLRLHYVDEGTKQSEHTFLCLQGEPTWSYLYLKIIPVFTQAVNKAIEPDLFGFGKYGMTDPIIRPTTMEKLHETINGCLPPFKIKEAGHFVQEWGEVVAQKSLSSFSTSQIGEQEK